jgi:dTDP-4-dehydrorhamnose reductase
MPLDLSADAGSWHLPTGVSVAFVCASIGSLERCRRNPAETRAVNVTATLLLAEMLMSTGAFVVFPSSSLVFDGSTAHVNADAPTCPRVEYGRQKALVEKELLRNAKRCCVLRLTKVLGAPNNLLCGWRDSMLQGRIVRPFSDLVMAPLPLGFAAQAMHSIGLDRRCGIAQISANEDISYEWAARYIARRIGASADLIRPVSVAESGVALEWVPRNTTLDMTRIANEYGWDYPPPSHGVEAVLQA